MNFRLLLLIFCTILNCGCAGFFGKPVTIHQVEAKAPSSVTIALSIDDPQSSISNLHLSDFSIIEEDVDLDTQEIGLKILSRDDFALGYTLLLLDLGGELKKSELSALELGLTRFAEKVLTTQGIGVYGFTGDEELHPIIKLPKGGQVPKSWRLAQVKGDKASRNLFGAVIKATDRLTAEIARSDKPLRQGTLVIWSRGPDLAGRKSQNEAEEKIASTEFRNYFIGPEKKRIPLSYKAGRTKEIRYDSLTETPPRLMDLGSEIRDTWQRQYIISYCSPARSGERQVEVRIHYKSESGKAKRTEVRTSFSADEFKAGCQSKSELKPSASRGRPSHTKDTKGPLPSPREYKNNSTQPEAAFAAPPLRRDYE